jgi:tRNA threonylcarbamoyladenosine biosynthesis protein TsaE
MEITYKLTDIPTVTKTILKQLNARTVLFYGDMGVGKTTLIKALARRLGVQETISSPTFSIVNEYEAKDCLLYHFDFYRIQDEEEALDIGIEEYFNQDQYAFIEWPEKVVNLLPDKRMTIKLTENDNGTRTANITPMQ